MKLLTSGYFYRNLGDDLFLRILANRYPTHQFHTLIHGDHACAYTDMPNVRVMPMTKLRRGMDKVLVKLNPGLRLACVMGKKADASVLIGGSMFQELAEDGSDISRLQKMPKNYNRLFVLGINFGPYKTGAYLESCQKYLAGATDVCFRDETSYGLFSHLPNTRLGSDIVFCIEDLCPGVKDKQNTCFISVMDFGTKKALQPYRDAYLHFLKEQVLEQQAMGRQVVLVSFCKVEGDETGIRDLLAILPQSSRTGVQTLCYDGTNWKTICQQISACACLIATRFHSVVLGLSYAVPTVAISYSNKTLQLLKDLGHEADAILPEQLSSLDTPSPITNVCVESLKQAAQRHFEKLDQFLG